MIHTIKFLSNCITKKTTFNCSIVKVVHDDEYGHMFLQWAILSSVFMILYGWSVKTSYFSRCYLSLWKCPFQTPLQPLNTLLPFTRTKWHHTRSNASKRMILFPLTTCNERFTQIKKKNIWWNCNFAIIYIVNKIRSMCTFKSTSFTVRYIKFIQLSVIGWKMTCTSQYFIKLYH